MQRRGATSPEGRYVRDSREMASGDRDGRGDIKGSRHQRPPPSHFELDFGPRLPTASYDYSEAFRALPCLRVSMDSRSETSRDGRSRDRGSWEREPRRQNGGWSSGGGRGAERGGREWRDDTSSHRSFPAARPGGPSRAPLRLSPSAASQRDDQSEAGSSWEIESVHSNRSHYQARSERSYSRGWQPRASS